MALRLPGLKIPHSTIAAGRFSVSHATGECAYTRISISHAILLPFPPLVQRGSGLMT